MANTVSFPDDALHRHLRERIIRWLGSPVTVPTRAAVSLLAMTNSREMWGRVADDLHAHLLAGHVLPETIYFVALVTAAIRSVAREDAEGALTMLAHLDGRPLADYRRENGLR